MQEDRVGLINELKKLKHPVVRKTFAAVYDLGVLSGREDALNEAYILVEALEYILTGVKDPKAVARICKGALKKYRSIKQCSTCLKKTV